MKKRLLKAMPRVSLLKLRPELSEEVVNDRESMASIGNNDVATGDNETNNNHDSEIIASIKSICTRFHRIISCRKKSGDDEINFTKM